MKRRQNKQIKIQNRCFHLLNFILKKINICTSTLTYCKNNTLKKLSGVWRTSLGNRGHRPALLLLHHLHNSLRQPLNIAVSVWLSCQSPDEFSHTFRLQQAAVMWRYRVEGGEMREKWRRNSYWNHFQCFFSAHKKANVHLCACLPQYVLQYYVNIIINMW